ncbi:hypothetical protein Belba_0499 [Belliella baltica DSM 15883]|uniref:DUF4136 domain-containing protein n=1 Tax=Belliella baltica (strain DSM 15883 / CIP 108006 / LMG 21964 / BA134) TaxID=866536 RepID=I3Z1N9_BELBD|nr:hypothetical protein [Belliella baltica]AFL83157.1 hypothetical protein Belba_0499 [Belliella baltica DSM 15883]
MKKRSIVLGYFGMMVTSIFLIGCGSLKPPTSIKNDVIENYQYFFITPTNSLTSSSGATVNGQYYSSSKTVNPSDVITGNLTKRGMIRLPELKPELSNETLIINYGESGKRKTGLGGYALEVTIQFVSSKANSLVCSCTAEGQGSTEADDIREAITRCLNELLL